MFVGILNVELFIPDSNSLKSKRYIIKSMKDRLKNRFNISIAEIDHSDKWQRTSLGIAFISNEKTHVESVLGKVMDYIYNNYSVEVIQSTITIV